MPPPSTDPDGNIEVLSPALRAGKGALIFTTIRSIQTPNAEDAVDAEARREKPIPTAISRTAGATQHYAHGFDGGNEVLLSIAEMVDKPFPLDVPFAPSRGKG